MQKRWKFCDRPEEKEVKTLMNEVGLPRAIATILAQRGLSSYEDTKNFFRPSLDQLHSPLRMKNMQAAVQRLTQALEEEQRILLYGDYDVDGTTAVALLYSVLKNKSKQLDYYIPDRYAEGYGVSEQGIQYAKDQGVELLITLDCGVKAVEKIASARASGIDVIVCDHHEPGELLPDALVLNPKQVDCLYPYKELSGCGVGFKLLQALYESYNWPVEELLEQLDLLAVSIAADIVPITGENRVLTYHGLEVINRSMRQGFKALFERAGKQGTCTVGDVVFTIAPRINAAGRLFHAKKAVELMLEEQEALAKMMAENIHLDNEERKRIDKQTTLEALTQLEQQNGFENKFSTIVYDPTWSKGVVGIVASRLIEKHFKPTIVLTNSNGTVTGSARSVPGFDLHHALESCSNHLQQFGGHYFAAGLSLLPEQLPAFTQAFEAQAKNTLNQEQLVPELQVDYELRFDELFGPTEEPSKGVPRFVRILHQMEPYGPGNMHPVFVSRAVTVLDVKVLKDEHIKLRLAQQAGGPELDAIFFKAMDYLHTIDSGFPIDVAYTLEVNTFRGNARLQLLVKDVRLHPSD